MKLSDFRRLVMRLALSVEGVPYIWGGQSPEMGFDCSGLVVWIFRILGIFPEDFDITAQGLYTRYPVQVDRTWRELGNGDLVLYGSRSKVSHVVVYVGGALIVGANGGGKSTTTREIAARVGARVKRAPIMYRSDMVGTIDLEDILLVERRSYE